MRALKAWQKWASGTGDGGALTTSVTIHRVEDGWVHYSYAEETAAGMFSGRNSDTEAEFRVKYPLWREDPPEGDDR